MNKAIHKNKNTKSAMDPQFNYLFIIVTFNVFERYAQFIRTFKL